MPATRAPATTLKAPSTEAPPLAKESAKTATPVAPKAPVKAATKTKTKPASQSLPATSKKVPAKKNPVGAKGAATEKPAKAKKIKMVRDSFTIPKPEFAVLDDLKLRAAKLSTPIKKTELIRAGIKALAAMGDANFLAALRAVPNLKTGRPAKA